MPRISYLKATTYKFYVLFRVRDKIVNAASYNHKSGNTELLQINQQKAETSAAKPQPRNTTMLKFQNLTKVCNDFSIAKIYLTLANEIN